MHNIENIILLVVHKVVLCIGVGAVVFGVGVVVHTQFFMNQRMLIINGNNNNIYMHTSKRAFH